MWHEARKHEKKLRIMVVDYKRRAERRREFYEKFKADPTQFMQVHGRPCKIHLDPQVTAAAENCMMPWQGNKDNMIDRFDVRAHLDIINEYHSQPEAPEEPEQNSSELNYERYRILIQNELSKTSEDKFLHQIHIEEQFGTATGPGGKHSKMFEVPKPVVPKAAIGYNYEDSNPSGNSWSSKDKTPSAPNNNSPALDPNEEDESDEELDFDLLVNMDDLNYAQKAELNLNGSKYGLDGPGDFMNFLNADIEEKEQMKMAKLQEEEKQAMSGRKARRERRAYKDRMILRKGYISPPSYAAADSPRLLGEDGDFEGEEKRSSSESKSRSSSPSKIEFITSFGGADDEKDEGSKMLTTFGPSLPSFGGLPRKSSGSGRKWARSRSRSPQRRKMRSRSKSRDRSRSISKSKSSRDNKSSRRRSSHSSTRNKSSKSNSKRHHHRRGRSSSSSSPHTSRSRRRRSRRNSSRSSSSSGSSRSRSRSRDRRKSRRSPRRSSSRSKSSRNGKSSRSGSKSGSSRSRTSTRRKHSRERTINSRSRHSSSDHKKSKSRRKSSSTSNSSTSRSKSKSRSPSSSRSNSRSRRRDSSRKRSLSKSKTPPRRSRSVEGVEIGERKSIKMKEVSKNGSTNRNEGMGDVNLPSPPLKRYYGRGKEDSESLSLSDSDSSQDKPMSSHHHYKRSDKSSGGKGKSLASSSTKSGEAGGVKLTPQERLKKKMQAALNRQLKADKEAEKAREEKLVQERMEREETLRELTIKYRRRERERRHKEMEGKPRRSRTSSYSNSSDEEGHNSSSSRGFRSSRSKSPSPSSAKRRKTRVPSQTP